MSWLAGLLLSLFQHSLSYAKFVLGLSKVALLRIALAARAAVVYITQYVTLRAAFFAAIFLAFQAFVAALAFLVVTPLSSNLLHILLPDGSEWAQGLYYLAWEEGLCLSTAWSLVLVYWANVFAVHRVIELLAQALTYRIMVWDGEHDISLGMLGGRQ